MPNNETSKILLINWKWESVNPINAEIYQTQTSEEWKNRIGQDDQSILKTYIAESNYHNKGAFVVACAIFQPAEAVLIDIIQHLYDKHNQPEIYLFLHRGNNYTGENLVNILNAVNNKVSKVFLFGHGSNYIYYNSQKKGFLDETGNFFSSRDENTKQQINTYNKKTEKLIIPYFDNVWHYYENEFDHKIQEFEQDLFDVLAHFTMPHDNRQDYPKDEFLQKFKEHCTKQDKQMCYRIKSFWGAYDKLPEGTNGNAYNEYTQLKQEREAIIELEKKRFSAYLLDDFLASVKHIDKNDNTDQEIAQMYTEKLKPALKKMFSNTDQESVTRTQITELQKNFAIFRELFKKSNYHHSNQTHSQ